MFPRLFFAFVLIACIAVAPSFASVINSENVQVPILLSSSASNLFPSRELVDSNIPSITSILSALQKQSKSMYVNPEVDEIKRVVILAYNELSTSDFGKYYSHFIYLLPALSNAATSMLYQDVSFLPKINSFSPLFESVTEVDCINTVLECANALDNLSKSQPTNTELIIVHVSTSSDASSLKSIAPIFQSPATVMIVTAAHSHPENLNFHPTSVSPANSYRVRASAPSSVKPTRNSDPNAYARYNNASVYSLWLSTSSGFRQVWLGPQYVTPNIFFGVILVFFLIFMLYQAIGCMTGIQRPVRLSAQTLAISKEY